MREHVDPCDRPKAQERAARGDSADLDRNLANAAHRARVEVRRKCMTIGANMLLTCTFRENVTDKVAAWAVWEDFIRLVHKRYPEFPYVVVAELQQRGAYHFHAAVVGWWDGLKFGYVRLCWERASRPVGGGTPHVRWKQQKMSGGGRIAGVAGYLSKYIGKGVAQVSRALNAHRFRASIGIVTTRVDRLVHARTLDEAREGLIALMQEYGDAPRYLYQSSLESDVPVHWWSCNWGRDRMGKSPP